MLLLCITGLPLIFHHEIDHALGRSVDPPMLANPVAERASIESIVSAAKARRPGDAVQFLVGDPDEPDVWFVRLGTTPLSEDISAFYTYDARTGELLGDYPLGSGFMDLMLRLHVDMFAGLTGTLFLGFMGLLLAASIVSGTVLYAPFMRKLAFGTVRRERSTRVKWLDLHNLLGIVTLVWLMVVTLTGVVNTLNIPVFSQWQATELHDMTAPYGDLPPLTSTASIDDVVAAANAAQPDKHISFMAFPGNDFASPHHFVAFMQGSTAWTSKLLTPVLIDARSAKVLRVGEMPWYVTTLLVSQPLHFGDYGGMPLKILWALLDILAIVVLGSGLYLWLKRGNRGLEKLTNLATDDAGVTNARPAVAMRSRP